MTDYLILRLYGPLASWGEIAVGESRHSAVHPSKSALLGLLGAALGVLRSDEAGQNALNQGYRFGIKLLCEGSLLRDYHTVQAPEQQAKVQWRSRRQELASTLHLQTLLSAREYRCDSLALVAVEALNGAPFDLATLQKALQRPHFPLYLGRKSCPLALPINPQQVSASHLREALDTVQQASLLALLLERTQTPPKTAPAVSPPHPSTQWPTAQDRYWLRPSKQPRYYWEDGMQAGMSASLQLIRHDQPLSRSRWQFAQRRESVFLSDEATA